LPLAALTAVCGIAAAIWISRDRVAPRVDHGNNTAAEHSTRSDTELEARYRTLSQLKQRIDSAKSDATAALGHRDVDLAEKLIQDAQVLTATLDSELVDYQHELAKARETRPQDGSLQWLTSQLLLSVGTEPEQVLPYAQRAVQFGLRTSETLSLVSKLQFELNEFDRAYTSAEQALELNSQSYDAWTVFSAIAFGLGRVDEVLQRLDREFPVTVPPWAQSIRRSAQELQREVKEDKRLAGGSTDDPLVRFVIEHQTFEVTRTGETTIRSADRGEVDVELFEDQAPLTVANFLVLAEKGFYNGTRFHWSDPAHMVVGGDPNTKNSDTSDDGLGGPGYTIPDEFDSPIARYHFRGTLTVMESQPRTAGSQFLICLVSCPEFNRHSTAFGRVVRGQDVIDHITQGRTDVKDGQSEKTIPGDLLVNARVLRKRPHPYQVTILR
jgi:cyclophilin family peptidyl-prolyl cis-trans isomerase